MNTKLAGVLALSAAVLVGIAFIVWHRGPALRPMGPVPSAALPAPAPADCLLPGPPPVAPNGAVVSAADMKLGHDVMQNFVLQLEAYQACRNAQADHAAPAVSQAQKDAWVEQGNQAVDEANALAASFGVQLKLFKARVPAK